MGYFFDKSITTCEYAVINFKNSDGTNFKAVRCMINENIDLPDINTDNEGVLDATTGYRNFTFASGWKDSDGNAVNNSVVPDPYISNDYFADLYNIELRYDANMESISGDKAQMQPVSYPYIIYSNKKIYLGNVAYQSYLISIINYDHRYDSNGDIVNGIFFNIDNIIDLPGRTTLLEPVFNVYKDVNKTQLIGTIKIEITVYHTSEQTGD